MYPHSQVFLSNFGSNLLQTIFVFLGDSMNSNFTSAEVTSSTSLIRNEPNTTTDKPDLPQPVSPRISTTTVLSNNNERVFSRAISVVSEGIPISEFKEYVKNSFANGEFAKQHKVRTWK